MGDPFGDTTCHAFEWTEDVDGITASCAGNVEGQAKRVLWARDGSRYMLPCEGKGDGRETFGLPAQDIATLVRTIR